MPVSMKIPNRRKSPSPISPIPAISRSCCPFPREELQRAALRIAGPLHGGGDYTITVADEGDFAAQLLPISSPSCKMPGPI